ncbi:MAG TPA: lytic transglycosylase domain-containing protein [Ktedonobacterales bacterium]|nr:lytic transglycosylase domain-containing protein [Ktedonobacterales bacterium]
MRRKAIGFVLMMMVLLVGVSLLWVNVGALPDSFFDALDWTSAASATPVTSSGSAPTSGNPLQAFGLSGPASCRKSEPPTQSPWLAVARADARKYKIDPLVFEWKIWQESGYQTEVVSPAGAIGIAQFMPATAAGMGIDPHDPRQALDASARLDTSHLKAYAKRAQQLAKHYGGWSARYGYALALAAYNAGPGALESAWNRAFGAGWASSPWAWLAQMAYETQRYVPNIINCSVQ